MLKASSISWWSTPASNRVTGAGSGVSASIAELADEAVEALCPGGPPAGVTLSVTTDGPALAPVAILDISRVLRNLVDNAIRHSPGGGAVTIQVTTGGSEVEVAVRDAGPGFPPDFADHAFEPFTRSDPARDTRDGHAGLGLAIARRLVEAHQGRIWIDDARAVTTGAGTLGLTASPAPPAGPMSASPFPAPHSLLLPSPISRTEPP